MIADDMIPNSLTDLARRPSALFLVGDQIYADDVADVLIKHLTHFGMKLVGYEELINGSDRKLTDTTWNGENWPEFSPSKIKKSDAKKEKSQVEMEQLERACEAMPKIRRVLANVPTYMIGDDHEITDDWNITKEWVENVRTSSCGMQVVASR